MYVDWNWGLASWIRIEIFSRALPKVLIYVGGSDTFIFNWTVVYGGRWVQVRSSQSNDLDVEMVAISCADCWDCVQKNPSMFITTHVEQCCTLWTWKIMRLRNWGWRSGVICRLRLSRRVGGFWSGKDLKKIQILKWQKVAPGWKCLDPRASELFPEEFEGKSFFPSSAN